MSDTEAGGATAGMPSHLSKSHPRLERRRHQEAIEAQQRLRAGPTPQQAAAQAEVAGRLAAYREARKTIHADIRRAAELGISTTEIARESGMTWHGVSKVLNREDDKA